METPLIFLIFVISYAHAEGILQDSELGLTQLAWQPESTQIYLGSPSIVKLPNGIMLASHDTFKVRGVGRVYVYRSLDNGTTWKPISEVWGCYWANLWTIDNTVYLLGTYRDSPEKEPRMSVQLAVIIIPMLDLAVLLHLVGKNWTKIRVILLFLMELTLVVMYFLYLSGQEKSYNPVTLFRSVDFGETWEGGKIVSGSWATGPMPTVEYNDYYVRTMEYWYSRKFGDYGASLLFGQKGHNLLDPTNWIHTKPLQFNPNWIPESWGEVHDLAFLEGNAVIGPDGTLYNILRVRINPLINKACILQFDPESFTLFFKQFIDFPGGQTKFVIRRDEKTGYYLSLSNPCTKEFPRARNVLVLSYSPNLFNWTIGPTLLYDDTGFDTNMSVAFTGFHTVDWQMDGEDIIYLIRTAYRGANSFHNSNRITYKRLVNFRKFLV